MAQVINNHTRFWQRQFPFCLPEADGTGSGGDLTRAQFSALRRSGVSSAIFGFEVVRIGLTRVMTQSQWYRGTGSKFGFPVSRVSH